MSKVVIQGNNSGTGTFTVTAPNSNNSREITLPDAAGTLDTLQRAGNVLQVVQGMTSTAVSVFTITYTDTTLTATITPTSTSSKILVMVDQQVDFRANTVGAAGGLRLLRGSTVIREPFDASTPYEFSFFSLGSGATLHGASVRANFNYLDSPNTTSSITYKTQIIPSGAGEEATAQYGSSSSITLLEIAG